MKLITIKAPKLELEIRRPGGQIELVDVTAKLGARVPAHILDKIKASTKAAGNGEVLRVIETEGIFRAERDEYEIHADAMDKAMSY